MKQTVCNKYLFLIVPFSKKQGHDMLACSMEKESLSRLALVVLLFISLWLPGCAPQGEVYKFSNDLIDKSYKLADNLIQNMEDVALSSTEMPVGKEEPILATTFVDVTTLQPNSTFGRIMADQVAARFVQKGYHLSETKLRKDGLLIHDGMGEVLLSRKLQEIGQSFAAAYVITGTYSIVKHSIFLNVKVISVTNSRVMASSNIEIEVKDAILDLLEKDKQKDKQNQIKRLTSESIY